MAGMGSLLQVRDVPDDVRRTLKARAAAQGESLNRYLLGLLEREAAQPTVQEVLDRAARRAGRGGVPVVEVLEAARREREDELDHRPS
jgi:plasmid stability protein